MREMHHVSLEFTAIIEKEGDWFLAFCPEVPGANGQGRTREEARNSLADAIALILNERNDSGLSGLTVDQRLRLLERIGESLGRREGSIPLRDALKQELDRRLAEMDEEEAAPSGIPWEEVLDRIQRRL